MLGRVIGTASHESGSITNAFAAVHIHGNEDASRLLADLDCNGWPQTPRNEALRASRRAHASPVWRPAPSGTVRQGLMNTATDHMPSPLQLL